MGKIYKNQGALTISLTTGVNITGATCSVAYRKPSGVKGSWAGSITDATDGVFSYTMVDNNQIDEAGKWTFWADVTFADTTHAVGEAVFEDVYLPGE